MGWEGGKRVVIEGMWQHGAPVDVKHTTEEDEQLVQRWLAQDNEEETR